MIDIEKIRGIFKLVAAEESHQDDCEFCAFVKLFSKDVEFTKLLNSASHVSMLLELVAPDVHEIRVRTFMDFLLSGIVIGIRYGRSEKMEEMFSVKENQGPK